MSLADTLGKVAKATGQKTIQGAAAKPKTAAKAKDSKSLKKLLGAAKVADATKGEIQTNFETAKVPTWSFSGLKSHENCNFYTALNKVDRIPQESGPAAARGSEIHDGCEAWVRGDLAKLPEDRKTKFDILYDDFVALREDFANGKVQLEEKWGVRKDWSPCTWDDPEIWGKGALDAFVRESETSCRIIDHKTGRKFGNEMKHADQGLCYALHTAHRYPEITTFQVEFWYIDQGVKTIKTFTRKMLMVLLARYHDRAMKMTTMIDFIPNSNIHACRFCSYGCNKNKAGKMYGNGHCVHDAYRGQDDE